MPDLLSALEKRPNGPESIADGATILRGFADAEAQALLAAINQVAAASPFRRMITSGGFQMSVAMTNCGAVGWITERGGYRYDPIDPDTRQPWPAMPSLFADLAARVAAAGGFMGFTPDACLINRYEPGARMSLHQDRDERDFTQPIVSVSLGLPCRFLWGGAKRTDKPRRFTLQSGDVVVWGGATRLVFHGVAPLAAGEHPLTGGLRFNLTFRQAL